MELKPFLNGVYLNISPINLEAFPYKDTHKSGVPKQAEDDAENVSITFVSFFKNIISGIQLYNEKYHHKLNHF